MQNLIKNTTCDNLVNYSNAVTSAANLFDFTPTESQDSLSFLMKNNVILNFSLIPNAEIEENKDKVEIVQNNSFYK